MDARVLPIHRGPQDVAAAELLNAHLQQIRPEVAGFGSEPDQPGDHDDAMAWSLYGRGFVRLAQMSEDPGFAEAARHCVQKLLGIASSTNAGSLAWGLPYAWKGQPAHHPYGITTAMCGDFLADAAEARVVDAAQQLAQVAHWLSVDLPWETHEDGGCPHFAPGFPYLATNVAARTAGFLLRAAKLSAPAATHRESGRRALRFVLSRQLSSGLWIYGEQIDGKTPALKVDNLHSGYVLEGLQDASENVPFFRNPVLRARTRRAVAQGISPVLDLLYPADVPRERAHLIPETEVKRWRKRSDVEIVPTDGTLSAALLADETRSWALGSMLVVLARSQHRSTPAGSGERVIRHIQRLRRPDGGFGYKSTDPTRYVRHEAHLFFGLAAWVSRGTKRSRLRPLRP